MITITEPRWAYTGFTRGLDELETKQIARNIEKFLLKENIVCDIEVKNGKKNIS